MSRNPLAEFEVLLADDERAMHRLVEDVLRRLGFRHMTSVQSGRAAIEELRHQRFDFIITDWRMGDLDGIDIVKFLRSPESRYPQTPVIMLTGNSEAHYVMTALNNGIDGYLIKPFSAEQLTKRIQAIIENPRPFVMAPAYRGPDRRRSRKGPPGRERRSKRAPPTEWVIE